jgi:branched-chain amino acid transport system ATP-binding protein
VKDVSKSFGGNKAVDSVSFSIKRDQSMVGLVGPNGAGKTTLLNVISGAVKADSGDVYFKGERINSKRSWERVSLGIAKTFQVPRPLRSLTVSENVAVFSNVGFLGGGRKDEGGPREGFGSVDDILRLTGLEGYAYRYPTELPFGLLKHLEVAKVLATAPDLLLFDEPIGGLSQEEAKEFIGLLRELMRRKEVKAVIVEHRLSELFTFVDSVMVLDKGAKIFEGSVEGFFSDKRVSDAYLGSSPEVAREGGAP